MNGMISNIRLVSFGDVSINNIRLLKQINMLCSVIDIDDLIIDRISVVFVVIWFRILFVMMFLKNVGFMFIM